MFALTAIYSSPSGRLKRSSPRILPLHWAEYLDLNAWLALKWPEISAKKNPLPEADEFSTLQANRELLGASPADTSELPLQ